MLLIEQKHVLSYLVSFFLATSLHGTRLKIDMAPATAHILKKASSVTHLRYNSFTVHACTYRMLICLFTLCLG